MINSSDRVALIKSAVKNYSKFLATCVLSDFEFSMTSRDKHPSPFARCFWIFGMHSIKSPEFLEWDKDKLASAIIADLLIMRNSMGLEEAQHSKGYKQLLAFSLSSLRLLGQEKYAQMEEFIIPFCNLDVVDYLHKFGTSKGVAGSGNHAMFLGQFLIEAHSQFNLNTIDKQNIWLDYHLSSLNKFGLWGKSPNLTYLQFQNGYHQYEILDFLFVKTGKESELVRQLSKLADNQGQFAPYPGGGGCFE